MRKRNSRRTAAVALAVAGLVLAGVGLAGVDFGGGNKHKARVLVPGGPARSDGEFDPLAYRPLLDEAFAKRAAAGYAHVLYAKSPGGVFATAQRVAAFRKPVEKAAHSAGVDPDELEALVFLESAGQPSAVAGAYPAGAVGLTQILAEPGAIHSACRCDLAGPGAWRVSSPPSRAGWRETSVSRRRSDATPARPA